MHFMRLYGLAPKTAEVEHKCNEMTVKSLDMNAQESPYADVYTLYCGAYPSPPD